MTPAEAVAEAGIKPEAVTDIIISHVHWDHADGIDLFPKARVWIQKAEYEHYVGPNGEPLDAPAITPEVAGMLAGMARAGRVTLVDGDDREIIPGHPRLHRRQAHLGIAVRRREDDSREPSSSRPTTCTCTRTSRTGLPLPRPSTWSRT